MTDLIKRIRGFLCIKKAKNPSPHLEKQIEESQLKLKEQVALLRLSNSELITTSKNLRWSVMQDLINDIARSK